MQVVLDLDGTLIDSTKRHSLVLSSILQIEDINIEVSHLDFLEKKSNGMSTYKYCNEVLQLSCEESKRVNQCWIEHIEDNKWLEYDVLYEDAKAFLDWNKKDGNTIIFLSARKNKEGLIRELKELSIYGFAKGIFVVNPSNTVEAKTNELIKIIGKNDIVFIGDTEADYQAGKNANVRTFILNRGFRSYKYLLEKGISSFAGLNDIIYKIEKIKTDSKE